MILDTLKEYGITKFRFANDFLLSRPTLDEYIAKYEAGETLPKTKYQIAFDSLFSKPLTYDEFVGTYHSFRDLLKRDRAMKLDNLDANETDSIINIVESLKDSIQDHESHLIPFIKYLTNSYSHNALVDLWINYFNDLNGFQNAIEYTDIDKKYIGMLYHINHSFQYDQDALKNIDDRFFNEYLKRKQEIKKLNEGKTQEVTNKIGNIIAKYVADAVANSDEEEDAETIVRKILEKIGTNN